jgi:hypothetical protein
MNEKKIRHAPTLFVFALFISFSCTAFGRSAHKCLGSNGQYEYTDKKCPPTTPPVITEKSGSAIAPQSGDTRPSNAAPASTPTQESAPIHPQHEIQPRQTVAPTATLSL